MMAADPLEEDMGPTFASDLERFAEDPFISAALSQGVDLRGYSRQIDSELREVEVESVREYVAQSGEVVDLHNQMQSCDAILKRMQEMLLGFQADLVGISDEIKHLQEESLSMNVKLRNRRAVEGSLKGFLEQVVLPPAMVSSICGNEVRLAAQRCRALFVVANNVRVPVRLTMLTSNTLSCSTRGCTMRRKIARIRARSWAWPPRRRWPDASFCPNLNGCAYGRWQRYVRRCSVQGSCSFGALVFEPLFFFQLKSLAVVCRASGAGVHAVQNWRAPQAKNQCPDDSKGGVA